jgi:hypothetical protein
VKSLWMAVLAVLAVTTMVLALPAPPAEGRADARFRFVHAVQGGPMVDLLIDDEMRAERLEFTHLTGYLPLAPGEHALKVVPTGGGTPVITGTFGVESDKFFTLMMIGTASEPRAVIVVDDNSPPVAGQARVRLINVSPDVGPVDAGSGRDLWFDGITYPHESGYEPVLAGRYAVSVWPSSADDPILVTPGVTLKAGHVHTLFLMGPAKPAPSLTLVTSTDAAFGLPTATPTRTVTPTPTPSATRPPSETPTPTATGGASVTPGASATPNPEDIYLPANWSNAAVDGR